MDLSKETQQRNEFRTLLIDLASSQELLKEARDRVDMYVRFEKLYDSEQPENRFRHFYSDIFSILTQIKQNPELGDIDILCQNLEQLRKGYKVKNTAADGKRVIDVSDALKKLYDHVNLDASRLAYYDAAGRELSGERNLEHLQSKLTEMEVDVENLQYNVSGSLDSVQNVQKELTESKKEYITILGIFASIVLAFTGGIAFTTSVLNNIAQASIYRTVSLTILIGLVLVNILFGLFYYINSLVSKEKSKFPLIISNVILIILLIGTILAWGFGLVENRDNRIGTVKTEQSSNK